MSRWTDRHPPDKVTFLLGLATAVLGSLLASDGLHHDSLGFVVLGIAGVGVGGWLMGRNNPGRLK